MRRYSPAGGVLEKHLPTEEARFGMDTRLQTYIVEDNLTIRENLIGTLDELTCATVVGFAETEDHARAWLLDFCLVQAEALRAARAR